MHPPFYVAPHQPGRDHPAPIGVKRNIRRGQPERLDLSVPPPGFPLEAYVPPRAESPLRPATSLRVRLGRALIRLGRALVGDNIVADPGQS